MPIDSWLQPHLEAVLGNGLSVLDGWRHQLPGLQGNIKNVENWILVELNHELLRTGFARCVLTNGFLAEGEDVLAVQRVSSQDVFGLGVRNKAMYLFADLSVRPTSGGYFIAEIKTGIAALELLDDVKRVRYYQGPVATRAEVGWVVMLPTSPVRRRSAQKSFDRICQLLKQEPDILLHHTTPITDWLLAGVIVPKIDGPPNKALERN